MSDLAQRLHSGYAVTEAGCWQWKRSLNSRGYGLISERGVVLLAHLEAVTCAENASRRPDAYKSHCVHGHALTDDNVIVKRRPNGRTIRNCRTCANAQRRIAYYRQTA